MQSKKVNIPSYIEDPTYRYFRPGLVLKTESRGNGVKTKLMNLPVVAKALGVPVEYPLKFLSLKFGSQPIFKKKGGDVVAILKGIFSDDEITKTLDKFVEKYLLCPKCSYPELDLLVKKKLVYGHCKSCGDTYQLDNKHEFATYIVKHPPPTQKKIASTPKESEESQKNEEIEEKDSKDETVSQEDQGIEIPLSELNDSIAEVGRLYAQQNVDTYKEKNEEINKILELLNSYPFKPHLRSFILFQAIFDLNMAKNVAKNKELIQESQKSLRLPFEELDLLLNLEYAIYETHKDKSLEKFIPTIFHTFYNQDLFSEEFLLEWSGNSFLMNMKGDPRFKVENDKKLQEAAREMIVWLKTAQTEDE